MTEHLEDRLKAAADALRADIAQNQAALTSAPSAGDTPVTSLDHERSTRRNRRWVGGIAAAAAILLIGGVVAAWPESSEPVQIVGGTTSVPEDIAPIDPDAVAMVPARLIGTIDTLEPPRAFAIAPSPQAFEELEVVTGAQADLWGKPVDFEQSIVVGAIANTPNCFAELTEFPRRTQSLRIVLAVEERTACDYSPPTPPFNRMYLYAVDRSGLPSQLEFWVHEVSDPASGVIGLVPDLDSSDLASRGIGPPPLDEATIGPDWYKLWSIGDEVTESLPTDPMELEWGCGFLANTDVDTNVRLTTTSPPNGPWLINAIYIGSLAARTPQGVGVGSTMEELVVAYGDELLIGETAWDRPDAGDLFERIPPSYYQPVAAVTNGVSAATFYLDGPADDPSSRVKTVKISAKADWGDDEGCA